MAPPSPGETLRCWFEEVWNRRDPSRVERYCAPDTLLHSLGDSGTDVVGPEAFKAFLQRYLDSFSDIAITVHEVVEAGPMVAGRWTASMTHTGDGLGIPPTGRRVTITGMSLARIEGGMIREAWDEWDRLGLARALGTIPG
jgi:predicted ester cyclase